jgi:tetratricopeptide (TPR) repeat protein
VYTIVTVITNASGAEFKTPTSFSITETKKLQDVENTVNRVLDRPITEVEDSITQMIVGKPNLNQTAAELAEALKEFQKAVDSNKNSSLAHYRIAEVFFLQRNYQAAANEYRESLNGDGEPKWTEVWSHIQLGKIFDLTGQRERAVNEYRQAVQTNDNTQGAIEEARRYLQNPYTRERTTSEGD